MIRQLVTFAIRGRVFVFGAAATLLGLGLWALSTIPFEAFPDITANSVSIITEAPGLAGQEVEQLVTFPIERALLGLPDAQAVRSTTKFGLVITQVVFRDPDSAARAVQNPNPVIAGRRANCNIAAFGPPRPAQARGERPE